MSSGNKVDKYLLARRTCCSVIVLQGFAATCSVNVPMPGNEEFVGDRRYFVSLGIVSVCWLHAPLLLKHACCNDSGVLFVSMPSEKGTSGVRMRSLIWLADARDGMLN